MASTKQMQERARAKRAADALFAKIQPNTVNWVDDQYSRLLAAQQRNKLKADDGGYLNHIDRVRKSPFYLGEEATLAGTLVWHLDIAMLFDDMVLVCATTYNARGQICRSTLNQQGHQVYLSKHSQERLFKRLRTNSPDDFKKATKALLPYIMSPPSKVGEERTLEVPGLGTFYMVGVPTFGRPLEVGAEISMFADGRPITFTVTESILERVQQEMDSRPNWLVKTFID